MATRKRAYHDGCAVAHALDLIGDRWALLVARELMLGPRRFSDLRAGLPGISANVLTQRLAELELSGIVQQRTLPPPATARVYALTEWGAELEPVLQAMGRWAARSPHRPAGAPMSVTSVVLSLRTMFDPAAAAGLTLTVDFTLAGMPLRARVADGRLAVAPAGESGLAHAGGDPAEGGSDAADAADVAVATDPDTFAGLIYGGGTLAEAERSGALTLRGDPEALTRFAGLFPLPPPAPADAGRD